MTSTMNTTISANLWGAARALFLRDLRMLWQRRGDAFQPLLFALLVVTLFAMGLGGDPKLLTQVAAAVLWVAMLLASLLTLDNLFRSDVEDGSLEQWLLSPVPLAWLVSIRIFTHWLTTIFPLVLITPLLSELLHLPYKDLPVLMITLFLGSPLLSLLGAVVAALTVSMRRAGILMGLLVLPLYIPVLVFGVGSVTASSQGLNYEGALLMLAAGLVLSIVLAPITAATAIRIALN